MIESYAKNISKNNHEIKVNQYGIENSDGARSGGLRKGNALVNRSPFHNTNLSSHIYNESGGRNGGVRNADPQF
jgi:hypothetical protein